MTDVQDIDALIELVHGAGLSLDAVARQIREDTDLQHCVTPCAHAVLFTARLAALLGEARTLIELRDSEGQTRGSS